MTLLFIVFNLVVASAAQVAVPPELASGLKCFGNWQAVAVVNTQGPGTLTFGDANGPIGSVHVESKAIFLGCVNKAATYTFTADPGV